jgi:hypothetical protein
LNLANITQAEKIEMNYPEQCETLHEKLLFYVFESSPKKREEVEIESYKRSSISQELWVCTSKFLMIDIDGLLYLTRKGEEKLEEIRNKDMTRFSQKRVLSAFRLHDNFTVRDVLYQLHVEATPTRLNTVRTRLRALIGLGKIVRVGVGEKKQILYAKATNEKGRERQDSVGVQLRIRKAKQDKQRLIMRVFQLALPGILTADRGQCQIDKLRDKLYG